MLAPLGNELAILQPSKFYICRVTKYFVFILIKILLKR